MESHPYEFSVVVAVVLVVVVVVVLARAVVVVRPPPFSSSEADFAPRNDSSAVTVKRVRFETSPRVTSESLPSVVVVAFFLDCALFARRHCFFSPSCFSEEEEEEEDTHTS